MFGAVFLRLVFFTTAFLFDFPTTTITIMDPVTAPDDDLGFTLDSVPASHDDTGLPMDTVPVSHEGPHTNMEPDLHELTSLPRSHLCVNCGVDTRRLKRFTLSNVEVRSIFQQWIAPQQVSDNSLVCHQCWMLARNAQQHSAPQERSVGHRQICVNCGQSVLRRRFHHILHQSNAGTRDIQMRAIIAEWIIPRQLTSTDLVCHSCWTRARRSIPQFTQASTSNQTLPTESSHIAAVNTEAASTEELDTGETSTTAEPATEATIDLPNYIRAPISQQCCFYPRCNQPERLTVPACLRARLFIDLNYYVSPTNRICSYHKSNTFGNELTEAENPIHTFTARQIEDFTDLLKHSQSGHLDFENIENMDNSIVHYWFGLSIEDILNIIREVPRLSAMHRGKTALAAYLMKLRTGDSDERISSLLNIPRSTLERLMGKVRELLNQDFVPQHLGLNHLSREEISSRNLIIPNGLFGGQERRPIVILDGTYIYIQKSSNYSYQKNTYSLHKYRNLVKPFLIVCCDGYIVDVLGPYPATTSDAQIMLNEFSDENSPLRQYFQANDVFILDRGFRDSVPLLEGTCNYSIHMPSSLQEGETQLCTLEANKTRCVTICRWVVEAVNGIFKHSFKLFRQEYFNNASKHIMIDFAIAASIINSFHMRIRDRPDANLILENVRRFLNVNNHLADFVQANHLNRRRTYFVNINADGQNITEFPQLTYNDLILFACGTYQLKQARSYYGEHIRAQGSYSIEVCPERDNSVLEGFPSANNSILIRGRIKSRHISRKMYFVYIIIKNDETGLEAIRQYCCNCISGRRTVGCCAHVMTIVWFLGWARFQSNINPPAQFLDDVLVIYLNENE